MRHDGGLTQGDGGGKGKMLLDPGSERKRRVGDDSKVFSLRNCKNWMNGDDF